MKQLDGNFWTYLVGHVSVQLSHPNEQVWTTQIGRNKLTEKLDATIGQNNWTKTWPAKTVHFVHPTVSSNFPSTGSDLVVGPRPPPFAMSDLPDTSSTPLTVRTSLRLCQNPKFKISPRKIDVLLYGTPFHID